MTEAENKSSSANAGPTDGPAVSRGWVRRIGQLALAAILLALAATSMVFVDETQSVIVERFGNIVQVYDHDADRGRSFQAAVAR